MSLTRYIFPFAILVNMLYICFCIRKFHVEKDVFESFIIMLKMKPFVKKNYFYLLSKEFIWHTVTSKNFGCFYFRTKSCNPKYSSPNFKSVQKFFEKRILKLAFKRFSFNWNNKKEGKIHMNYRSFSSLSSIKNIISSSSSSHFLCPQWFHVLLTLASRNFL